MKKHVLTGNEVYMIVGLFDGSYMDKCKIETIYNDMKRENKKETASINKELGDKVCPMFEKKLKNNSIKVNTNERVSYKITADEYGVNVKRNIMSNNSEHTFKMSWEKYGEILSRAIDNNKFMNKTEQASKLFLSMLIDKHNNKESIISLDISNDDSMKNKDLIAYFKNVYSYILDSKMIQKYLEEKHVDSAENFKNRLLLDKEFTNQLMRRMYAELDRTPVFYPNVNYINKIISSLMVMENIDDVRKKCGIHIALGDKVQYKGKEYRIENIKDRNIILKNNNDKIALRYKEFKNICNEFELFKDNNNYNDIDKLEKEI